MLTEVFAWWMAQMRSLLPGRIANGKGPADAVIVALQRLPAEGKPLDGAVLVRRNGNEQFLQPLWHTQSTAPDSIARLPSGLRLPLGTVLERPVELPLTAERDLTSVIGFEMDRLTPFASSDVFWGISGLKRDRVRARLSLTLSLVPRAQVRAVVAALAPLGLAPDFIESTNGRIELTAAPKGHEGYARLALLGLCAALGIAALLVPFLRQQILLTRTEQQIAALTPAAHEALHLRARLAISASGQAEIAAAEHGGNILHDLASLTDALPDGTWLSDLSLKSGELTIDGQSSNSARLITLLSAIPLFPNPSFDAPVTRSLNGKTDLFSIHASVAE
jgi:general secretion pathway protein L